MDQLLYLYRCGNTSNVTRCSSGFILSVYLIRFAAEIGPSAALLFSLSFRPFHTHLDTSDGRFSSLEDTARVYILSTSAW